MAWELAADTLQNGSNWILSRLFHVEHGLPMVGGRGWTTWDIVMFHVEQIVLPMSEIRNRIVSWLQFCL